MFPFGMKLMGKEDYLEKDLGVKDRLKQLQMVSKSLQCQFWQVKRLLLRVHFAENL